MKNWSLQPKKQAAGAFLLVICALGTLTANFSNGGMTTALPELCKEFSISTSQGTIITVSYVLVTGILTLPLGRISDMVGYKKMYLLGQILVTLGTLAGGALSNSVATIVIFRAIMAIGTAMVQAVTQALLQRSFPPEKRGKILGINSACLSASGVVSMLAAGWLVDMLNWRWIFYVMVPLGVIVTILVFFFMEDFKGQRVKLDYPGTVWLMAFLITLMLCLNGRVLHFNAITTIILGAAAALTLVLFIVREKRADVPLIDLHIFRFKTFDIGNIGFLVGYILSGIINVSLGFYLSYTRGYDARTRFWFTMIQVLMMGIMASFVGALSDKIGTKKLSIAGMGFQALGLLGYSLISVTSSDAYLLACLICFGFGSGLFYAPTTSMVMGSVPPEDGGMASGMTNTMRNVAQALGQTIFAVIIAASTAALADSHMSEAAVFVVGLKKVTTICVVLAVICVGLFVYLLVDERKAKRKISEA